MAVSRILMSFLVCCTSVCVVVSAAERDGVREIKSNSPNAHVETVLGSRAQRLRRETSGSGLTEEERQNFLTAHNNYRRTVEPPAANMEEMVWDDKLASMAQQWADDCSLQRGKPARDNLPYSDIGQNILMLTQAAPVASTATRAWYNRVSYYSFEDNSCDLDEDCDPYMQVVWADSSHIGCAIGDCSDITSSIYNRFCVCYYAPAGNAAGRRPYAKGEACSACPNNTTCQSKLCAWCTNDFYANGNNEGGECDNSGGGEAVTDDSVINEGDNDEGVESDKNEGGEGDNTEGDESGPNEGGEGGNIEDGETDISEDGEGGDDNEDGCDNECFFSCPRQAGYVATPIRWFYPVVSVLVSSRMLW